MAAHYGVDLQSFRNLRAESISRDVAAWLSRQLTSCTLRELAVVFGLSNADSVRNLTRRVDRAAGFQQAPKRYCPYSPGASQNRPDLTLSQHNRVSIMLVPLDDLAAALAR